MIVNKAREVRALEPCRTIHGAVEGPLPAAGRARRLSVHV